MDQLSNIKINIDSNIIKLKREWSTVRGLWKDAKANEYEKNYLIPIVIKQKDISSDIASLERISDKLKSLGVDL